MIKVIRDTFHHELYLRFFGEVQKEVLKPCCSNATG